MLEYKEDKIVNCNYRIGDNDMAKIKVGVAGYGTIGQRLADGVAMQGDMELVGIADLAPTLSIRALAENDMIGANNVKYNLYLVDGAATEDNSVKALLKRMRGKVEIIDGVSRTTALVRAAGFVGCSYTYWMGSG